jgi:hypothetical protein
MMFGTKKPEKREGTTLAEAISGNSGVRINLKEMNDYIKKCETKERDSQCRKVLKEVGVEFLDE